MKAVRHILTGLDRYLPAIFLAALLSFQGLLATGAADGALFPELRGPDGRTLTFAELCNSLGEDGSSADHCASCSLHGPVALPHTEKVSFVPTLNGHAVLPAFRPFLPETPERWQYFRRGPPAFT